MFIFIPSARKLDPKIKKALQNRQLSKEQIHEIQKEVAMNHQNLKKGFRRALIISAGVFVLLIVMSLSQLGNPVILVSIAITGGILIIILLFIKWFHVDLVHRQFVRALKKGYPDFDDEMC